MSEYRYIREALLVKRYHTVGYVAMPETVGHHTGQVIAILFHLYKNDPPINVLRYALHHDVPELTTGDVPATAKWRSKALSAALDAEEKQICEENGLDTGEALTHLDRALFKFADMIDLCFKAAEEISCGNAPFSAILARGLNVLNDLRNSTLRDNPQVEELMSMLRNCPFVEIHELVIDGPDRPVH